MSAPSAVNVIDLLSQMVGFETVNKHISGRPDAERELACFLEAQAAALGLATRRLEVGEGAFDLLVTADPHPGRPWLLFESHLDTVSVAGMSIAPFAAERREGRMYGRGACDTKASGAAMLCALAAARERTPNNLALLFSVDEEVSKAGALAFAHRWLPELGWRPAGVIVGEPTLLQPVAAHNGVVRWAIRTGGRAAHSSDPSQGRSAISAMARVVQAIERNYLPTLTARHPLTGKAQGSINLIRGGSQINIIPDECVIELDRRVVPGEQAESVLPAVETVLEALRREDPELEVRQEMPSLVDPPLDPLGGETLLSFVQGVLTGLGLPAAAIGVPYATDASNYRGVGLPSLVLGPGDIAQAHTKDEWIALDQVTLGEQVYTALMLAEWPR